MLRPSKKLTKREIQEDALVTLFVKAQKFYRQHSQKVYIGAAAIAIIAILAVFMAKSKKSAEYQASGKLGELEQVYFDRDYQRALPGLQQIIDTYPGTKAAGTATFLIANAYYSSGNVVEAERQFRNYVNKYKDDKIFTASAYAGVAASLDSQKKYSDAAAFFERAAKAAPKAFSAPFYLIDAARCLKLSGNNSSAGEMYKKIIADFPNTSTAQDARFYLEALSQN